MMSGKLRLKGERKTRNSTASRVLLDEKEPENDSIWRITGPFAILEF